MKKFILSSYVFCCLFFISGLYAVNIRTNAGDNLTQNINEHVVRLWEGLARDAGFAVGMVPAQINLPAQANYAAITNQNHPVISLLLQLQNIYISNPAIFNNPPFSLENRELIYDKVSDARFIEILPDFSIDDIDKNPKKRNIALERSMPNINPVNVFPILQASYEYEFSDPVKKGLARLYAVSLFSTIRNQEPNESEINFIGKFDIDLMDHRANNFRELNEANPIQLSIKNEVRRQYNLMYERWIDGSSMNFGGAIVNGILRDLEYLMNPGIPGFSFIPQFYILAPATIDDLAESCYRYLNSWETFGKRGLSFFGFDKIAWNTKRWISFLHQELLKEIEMKMILRKNKRVSSGPIEKLTNADLAQLSQNKNIAPCNGLASLREIAKHWASNWTSGSLSSFFKEDEDRWFLIDNSGKPAEWLDILPTECREDLCRYYRCLLTKNNDSFVEGSHICRSGACRMKINYMTELEIIKLPSGINQIGFDAINNQEQALLFARDFIAKIEAAGNNQKNITKELNKIKSIIKLLPESFIKEICRQYAYQTAFQGILLEQIDIFKKFIDCDKYYFTISLSDLLVFDGVREKIKKEFNQKRILNLSFLNLNRITSNDFVNTIANIQGVNLGQVTELDISNNMISDFPLEILNHFPNLRTLTLSNNLLKTLNEDLFGLLGNGFLPNLRELKLDHNEIERLPQGFFKGLANNQHPLDLVDLSHNRINNNNFLPLFGSLKVANLNLSYNALDSLPVNIFSHMVGNQEIIPVAQADLSFKKNIRELNLSNNRLNIALNDNSHRALASLSEGTLEFLNLNNNDMIDINSIVRCNINSLKHLFLDNNKIERLMEGLLVGAGAMDNLETLSLAKNKLLSIYKDDLSLFTNLKRLILSENKIRNIFVGVNPNDGSGLSCLINLELLAIDRNEIEDISVKTFRGLRHLKILHLEGNKISRFEDNVFSDLDQLEALYLFGNAKIFSYDDCNGIRDTYLADKAFHNLTRLHFLDLSYNRIKDLPDNIFSGLTELTHLNLGHNRIQNVSNQLAPLINLEEIDLSENRMESISRTSFYNQRKINTIHFKGNDAGGVLKPLSSFALWSQGKKLDMEGSKKFSHDITRLFSFMKNNSAMKIPGLYSAARIICWALCNPIRMERTIGRKLESLDQITCFASQIVSLPKPCRTNIDNYYNQLENIHRTLAFGDQRNNRISVVNI